MSTPSRMLFELLLHSAQQRPDEPAVVAEGCTHSYAELLHAAAQVSQMLREEGLQPGDRVCVFMPNGFMSAAAIFGISLAGGVFICSHYQLKTERLRAVLIDSAAKFLLTHASLARVHEPATQGLDLKQWVWGGGETSAHDLQTRLAASTAKVVRPPSIPLDLASLIYTSGSTGEPKGVMMTHQAMVFTAGSIVQYLQLGAEQKVFSVLPLSFTYGLYQLLAAVAVGACLVLERGFSYPGQVVQRLREEQPQVFAGVPTIYQTLVRLSAKKPILLPSMQVLTNAAAALPWTTVAPIQAIFPNARLYKMYGLTECTRVCYLPPERLSDKPSSVGVAIPGSQVCVLDAEGHPVAPGQVGKLHVRGPHVMLGYWRQPEKTAQMLRPGPLPGQSMLCTQDWFRQDEEGLLYFVARSDDIIKTRGEKVSPVEVEHVLHAIEGVQDACVIGVPDEVMGHKIRAYLSLVPGAKLSERQVRLQCAQRLEPYMIPTEVRFEEALPKTGSGKVHKQALKDRDLPSEDPPDAPLDSA